MNYLNSGSLNETPKEVTEIKNTKIKQVSEKPAKIKKKGAVTKFVDEFVPDDMEAVKSNILLGVIVPAAKNIFLNIIDILLNNGDGGGTVINGRRGINTGGSKYHTKSSLELIGKSLINKPDDRLITQRRSNDMFIFFDDRLDAERVLSIMKNITVDGGIVSMADYFELSGCPTDDYTYNYYGWDWEGISLAKVIYQYDYDDHAHKYTIKLPKAVPIKHLR